MESFRKWFYKPRRDDTSMLAQFFYADDALNLVAAELDSFDGRKDPERCTLLVNHLRQCQDKVLTICNKIMDELIPDERADRDFRVKFPDDVMQDNLAGQLWFGAECLAAGSSIMNREIESGAMRPLAKALTKALENVRNLLREASLRANIVLPANDLSHDRLVESLKMFDRLLAQFELCYVSAMVPVKSVQEYELQQCVIVLFSETLQRALQRGLLNREQIDQYDPALMFTIPRLAIVAGLLVFPEGPLSLDDNPHQMSEMFRPFRALLIKIRELLWTLSEGELLKLEKMLCSSEELLHSSLSDVDISEVEDATSEECAGETSECETVLEAVQNESGGNMSVKDSQISNGVCVFSDAMRDDSISSNLDQTFQSNVLKDEDSISFNSCLDSGLGTLQSNSDPSSLSDRSPDTLVAKSSLDNLETVENERCKRTPTGLDCSDPSPSGSQVSLGDRTGGSSPPNNNCDIPKCSDAQEEDDELVEGSIEPGSSPMQESGFVSLNGQWTLPVIPCSCSHTTLVNEDANMTHRGLINRGIPQDDGSYLIHCSDEMMCSSCLNGSDVVNHSNRSSDDVRWHCDSPGTSNEPKSRTNESVPQDRNLIYTERTVSIVDTSGAGELIMQNNISSSVENSVKLNSDKVNVLNSSVIIDGCRRFSAESWKRNNKCNVGGESSVNLQVRYADNWEALCHSCELPAEDGQQLPSKHREVTSSLSSSCSSCHSNCSVPSDSYSLSSDTSSFNSEDQDEEEVALAVKAIEAQKAWFKHHYGTSSEARAKYRSSADLIHRLFVCIAGVADQLQTNFAGDLRNILKSVFLIHSSDKTDTEESEEISGSECCENGEEALVWGESESRAASGVEQLQSPPPWVPDEAAPLCMACQASFTVVRRRHHCRNCGKVFCARCSSNSVPLPRFGHLKPVRVCNRCFIYQVTPFLIDQIPTSVS